MKLFYFLVLAILLSSVCFARLDNDKSAVSYVSDATDRILYEAGGAWDGIRDSDWAKREVKDKNPSERDLNSYLKKNEFVFFAGHGSEDLIGGNIDNGFSDNVMEIEEIDSGLRAKVALLMTCRSLKEFGEALVERGVDCVVGWKKDLVTESNEEGYDWAYYFFKCPGWHDPDFCEDYASLKSGVYGSSAKGDCNSFSMEGNLIEREEAIQIAKEHLDVPLDYRLHLVEEEDDSFIVVFQRYYKGIRVVMDEYAVLIDRESGDVELEKKEFTASLDVNVEPVVEVEDLDLKSKELIISRCDGVPCLVWHIQYVEGGFLKIKNINAHYGQEGV